MSAMSLWLRSGLVAVLLIAGVASAQDDTKAVIFNGTGTATAKDGTAIPIGPCLVNPRLDMTLECTIEMWIKLDKGIQPALMTQPVCVMSCNEDSGKLAPPSGPAGSPQMPIPGKVLWGVYFNGNGFYVSADGKPGTGLATPRQGRLDEASRPAAFTLQADTWMHVVLAVTGPYLEGPRPAFRDGQTHSSFILPNPTAAGRLLTFGSGTGGTSFKGSIGTIRFYDRALTAAHIAWLWKNRSFDEPGKDCPVAPYLLAHWNAAVANPVNGEPEYVVPKIFVTKFHGGTNGTQYFSRRPLGTELRAVFVKFTEGNNPRSLARLQVEYDWPGEWTWWGGIQGAAGPNGSRGRYSSGLPVVLPDFGNTFASAQYARGIYSREMFPGMTASAVNARTAAISSYKQVVTGIPPGTYFALAVQSKDDRNPMTDDVLQTRNTNWTGQTASPPIPYSLFRPPWTGDLESSKLTTGEPVQEQRIIGIAGLQNGDLITSLSLEMANGTFSDLMVARNNPNRGDVSFRQSLPTVYPNDYPDGSLAGKSVAAKFEGFVTLTSDRGLHGIALAYSFPHVHKHPKVAPGTTTLAQDLTRFRWIVPAEGGSLATPVLDQTASAKAGQFHGNFTSDPVYAFKYDPARKVLTLWRDLFNGPSQNGLTSIDFAPEKQVTNGQIQPTSRWVAGSGDYLMIEPGKPGTSGGPGTNPKVKWVDPKGNVITLTTPVKPASTPFVPSNSGGATPGQKPDKGWNVLFQNQDQVNALDANYVGWDITRLEAGVYYPTRISQNIWKPLADGDFAYYKGLGTTKYIPNSMFFSARTLSKVLEKSRTNLSSHEDQSSWGLDLGRSIGVPGVGSFSMSLNYKSDQSRMASEQRMTIRTRCVNMAYSIVVDRSVAELAGGDGGFKKQLNELLKQVVLGQAPAWDSFFDNFGTHYPYAITYGSTCTRISSMKEDGYKAMSSSGWGLQASAEVDAEKAFKVGNTGGYNQSAQQMYENSRQVENTKTQAYGGDLNDSGGFTPNKEWPIFLDLRPTYELLSPIFFDDPAIWKVLRPAMVRATDAYISKAAASVPWTSTALLPWVYHYPLLLPKKERETLEVKANSRFILQNKSTGNFVGPTLYGIIPTHRGVPVPRNDRQVCADIPLMNQDQTQATVFTFQNPNNSGDNSIIKTGVQTLILADNKNQRAFNRLVVETWALGYEDTSSPNATWTLERTEAGKTDGSHHVYFHSEVRIKNINWNQYIYDSSGKQLWSTSSQAGGDTVWIILPAP